MPEISRFHGLVIKMLYMDEGKHHKPHVHAYYGDYEASVAIDGEILAGSLPTKQYRLLVAWMILHEDELYQTWNKAVAGREFGRIDPLA